MRVAWTFLLALASAGLTLAQTASPGPQFQYASITGSGNIINLTRVPVTTASGTVVYQDIVLQFDNDGNGNLTVTAGYPTVNLSPNLLVSSFMAGKYVGPATVL